MFLHKLVFTPLQLSGWIVRELPCNLGVAKMVRQNSHHATFCVETSFPGRGADVLDVNLNGLRGTTQSLSQLQRCFAGVEGKEQSAGSMRVRSARTVGRNSNNNSVPVATAAERYSQQEQTE